MIARETEDRALQIIAEYQLLEGQRGNWDHQYEQIAARIWPSYSGHALSKGIMPTSGQPRTVEMIDATGSVALTRFAAVLYSMLTPQNVRWHYLRASDPTLRKDRAVREYFETATQVLFDYRYAPKANYSGMKVQEYMALGAFGTAPMYIDRFRGFDEKGLRYKHIPIFGMQVKNNHQGIVDCVYRKFMFTARQVAQRFERVPKRVLDDLKDYKTSEREHWFIQAVKPRDDYARHRKDARGMRYEETYVYVGEPEVLEEAGYHVFPFSVSRYITTNGETLGRSPAMICLPSLKTLNEEKKTVLKQGQKAVDPVLLLHDDGVLDSGSVRAGGYITGAMSAEGRPLVGTLPTGNLAVGHEMMNEEKSIINDAFLVTLFQLMIDSPQKTATEVAELAREKGVFLTPMVTGQETESLGPQIERELDVLAAQQVLPPMPQRLRDAAGEYQVIFDSPASKMAKAGEASGFMQIADWAAEKSAATGDRSIMRPFNWKAAIPAILELKSTPLDWIKTPGQIEAEEQADAQAAQQQQMIDAAPSGAAMMKTAMAAGQ